MEKQIYDEKNGLWYELQGDYYLPCLTLPPQENSRSASKDSGICGISSRINQHYIPRCRPQAS